MKELLEWVDEFLRPEQKPIKHVDHSVELLEYNSHHAGVIVYPCVRCKEDSQIYCEPEEFDPDSHYCGRSPRCCP